MQSWLGLAVPHLPFSFCSDFCFQFLFVQNRLSKCLKDFFEVYIHFFLGDEN